MLERCNMVVVLVPFVLPWGYVMDNYVSKPAAAWRSSAMPAA